MLILQRRSFRTFWLQPGRRSHHSQQETKESSVSAEAWSVLGNHYPKERVRIPSSATGFQASVLESFQEVPKEGIDVGVESFSWTVDSDW